MTNQEILYFVNSGDDKHGIIRKDLGNGMYRETLVKLDVTDNSKKVWREDLGLWEATVKKRFYTYYIYTVWNNGKVVKFKRFFRK